MSSDARRSARVALSCWLVLVACGSADHSEQERPASGSPVLNVEQGFNICPQFQGSLVLPQTIAPRERAIVAVIVSDPDGDDAKLSYVWTASSGSLDAPDSSQTGYVCDDTGAQVLHVVAEDARGCHVALDITVTCLSR